MSQQVSETDLRDLPRCPSHAQTNSAGRRLDRRTFLRPGLIRRPARPCIEASAEHSKTDTVRNANKGNESEVCVEVGSQRRLLGRRHMQSI
jgi:hypothetical protein